MVGSFEAWYDEKRIARGVDKYIGEIRYEGVLVKVDGIPTQHRSAVQDGRLVAA